MIELTNVPDGYNGPVILPPEHISGYERITRTLFMGENYMGPQYSHHHALEITLDHGQKVLVLDTPENRLRIAMHHPEREEWHW